LCIETGKTGAKHYRQQKGVLIMRQEIIVHVQSFIMEVDIPEDNSDLYDDAQQKFVLDQIQEYMSKKTDFAIDDYEVLDERY